MGAFSPWESRIIQVHGYPLKVYDLIPSESKAPIPVVICPGWVEVPESHRQHMEWLAAHGRRVIAFDAPHGLPLPYRAGIFGYYIEFQKMETLVGVLDALGLQRVDLIGRSEGAIWALLTAHYYDKRVRNVVLQNPAGLIGPDSLLPFFFRWIRDQQQTRRNEENDPPPYAPVPMDMVLKRDPWRSARALWAIMHSDAHRDLTFTRIDGIKIAIISTDHDRLFPIERVIASTLGLIDKLHKLRGSHTSYFCRPEEFAAALDAALDELERTT